MSRKPVASGSGKSTAFAALFEAGVRVPPGGCCSSSRGRRAGPSRNAIVGNVSRAAPAQRGHSGAHELSFLAVTPAVPGANVASAMRSSRRTARRSRTGALVATSSLGGDLRDEPFPPMILLPLVNDAAQAGASDIRISAGSDAVPGSVWVAVEATPPLRWSDDRLEHLRGLARIYLGPSTVIDVEHRAGASAVLLRFARDADRRTRTRMLHGVPS